MSEEFEKFGDLFVRRGFMRILQENGLGDFDALMRTAGQGSLRKKGLEAWRERVALSLNTADGPLKLYVKRYSHPPLKQQLNRLLRAYSSTAQIEMHWLEEVLRLGIGVPATVAYGARQQGLKEVQSLLLTQEIPGESLERWLPARVLAGRLDATTKASLSAVLAETVARLHAAGLIHRDLYLSHIFVRESSPGAMELFLIDLQRVIKPQLRRRRWVVKDLAALHYSTPRAAASRSDRLRWLKRYLRTDRLSPADKSLIRAVGAKAERIRRHSEKHGLG